MVRNDLRLQRAVAVTEDMVEQAGEFPLSVDGHRELHDRNHGLGCIQRLASRNQQTRFKQGTAMCLAELARRRLRQFLHR